MRQGAWGACERSRGQLEVLSDQECLELLASRHFGRLAFTAEGWPLILPVNYVFQDPSIIVRTGPGAKLEEAPLTVVAFEVDEADPEGLWGWSVCAKGPPFDITDARDAYSRALRRLPVRPWAPGDKANWLKISVARLSGRRFGELSPRR